MLWRSSYGTGWGGVVDTLFNSSTGRGIVDALFNCSVWWRAVDAMLNGSAGRGIVYTLFERWNVVYTFLLDGPNSGQLTARKLLCGKLGLLPDI